MKRPDFFIVGAPRCGTTAMYHYLEAHPEIFMSEEKEPHYFSSIETSSIHPRVIRDKKKYLALFKKANNAKAIGEASTSYLWDPESAKLIHNTVP
ncbi:MAG: sulfotransferase, partial [Proteobacteria bacterium]|nr:sulfotransferase [Pseudomonadota bacterium]